MFNRLYFRLDEGWGSGHRLRHARESASEDNEVDAAAYLFDLLIAARRVAVTRRFRFLAYLIGMAAEEARLLTQGRSAVPRKKAEG